MNLPTHTASEVIGQMAGSVSVCWVPRPTGVFDSEHARKYVEECLATLEADLLAIIGEDEDWHSENGIVFDPNENNALRAKQRIALLQYMGSGPSSRQDQLSDDKPGASDA